jgi:hypothetical protein
MSQVTFSIPDEILFTLKATPEVLAARIRIAAAVKQYEMGQLSGGSAAELAGVPKPYFLGHLADYGVNTFDLSGDSGRADDRVGPGYALSQETKPVMLPILRVGSGPPLPRVAAW